MKAIVLLSGGIDSSTCLALMVSKYSNKEVMALNVYYGQKHVREMKAARDIASYYGVELTEIDLAEIFSKSDCSLLQASGRPIPHESYASQLKEQGGKPVSTYVPFRNGLMLAAAATIAVSVGAEEICYGAHADDAAGNAYPDCSDEFTTYMAQAIYSGTGNQVRINAPFVLCNKAEVVRTGLKLNVPYELTWSCYEGGDKPCGICGTCRDRIKAFELNGVKDPL